MNKSSFKTFMVFIILLWVLGSITCKLVTAPDSKKGEVPLGMELLKEKNRKNLC